jgi:predicted nucleic acid-binding Zn ribbon protein
MPTYVYRFIETDETIEVQQAFTDDALTQAVHPATGELLAVRKVFLPVGVTFKGSGFYKNDSRGSSTSTKSSSSTTNGDTGSSSSEAPSTSSDTGTTKTDAAAPKQTETTAPKKAEHSHGNGNGNAPHAH